MRVIFVKLYRSGHNDYCNSTRIGKKVNSVIKELKLINPDIEVLRTNLADVTFNTYYSGLITDLEYCYDWFQQYQPTKDDIIVLIDLRNRFIFESDKLIHVNRKFLNGVLLNKIKKHL